MSDAPQSPSAPPAPPHGGPTAGSDAEADVDPYPGLPPFVYAPVVVIDDEERLSMDTLADGRTAAFVYSAIDRLHDMYGEAHPWAVATGRTLAAARQQAPYDVLLLDTVRRLPATPAPATARTASPAASQPPGIFLAGSTPVTPTTGDAP